VRALALRLLPLLLFAGTAIRAAGGEESPTQRMKAGHCGCQAGEACWHYLRAPMKPPEDPCRCGVCANQGSCGGHPRPKDWSAECMASDEVACFWKRHAASWRISCSRCATDTSCTACALPGAPDAATKAKLLHQLALEVPVGRDEANSSKRPGAVAWTKHFYCATDIPSLRVVTQNGGYRFMDTHEIVHLFLERAEKARDDFVEHFGDELRQDKPLAIYLAAKKRKAEGWRSAYFGGADTDMVYAGAEGKIAGGFCWNGFGTSLDELAEDRDLHGLTRHMIGHILFSCWHGVNGFNQQCPRWAFVASADWLCKIHPLLHDWVLFCTQEGPGPTGNGKMWHEKAKVIAGSKRIPADALFGVPSMSKLTYEDHIRSWSYMDTMLREDRARWLATLRKIREGKEHSQAFRDGLGMTPQDFDQRWSERMSGKRQTMAERPRDAAEATEGVDAADRRRIKSEADPKTLSALIRGLDHVRDVKTAETVLSRLSVDSDSVRESVVMLLEKTKTKEVLDWLRTSGLAEGNALARACVARALGTLKDAAARPRLEQLLDDAHWLVRANAAFALQRIADPASVLPLQFRMDDSNPKAWIAKADALASFGQAGSGATPAIVERLSAREWQVRLTACRALAVLGDADAVEPLIERLETEHGRIHREILRALRAVTHETFGPNPVTWRNWWKSQKPKGLPPPPPPSVKKNPEDDRYAPPKRPGDDPRYEDPTYYGRRMFAQSAVFVLDLSLSMETSIETPKEFQEKLGTMAAGTRADVARASAKKAIASLDPRVRFNLVFFSTEVKPWKDALMPLGPIREAAISAVQNAPLEGETNIFGALKAAFGLHEKPTLSADLDSMPDEIWFLTDGTPTHGDITDNETILSWVRDLERFAKVKLNVIAMGSLGLDLPFLKRMADENGGDFIHVPDRAR
jgi:HEAT repeat protein